MFRDRMFTEAIPERVYALCCALKAGIVEKDMLRDVLEKIYIQDGKETSSLYFNNVYNAAIELDLVKEDNKKCELLVDKKVLASIDDFRKHVMPIIIYKKDSLFYKVSATMLAANEKVLEYDSFTGDTWYKLQQQANDKIDLDPKKDMLAWRFWATFIGLGMLHRSVFLPNMYINLKDAIELSILEKNKEYTANEFFEKIYQYISEAIDLQGEDKHLNLGLSNGLRMLHDTGVIEMKYKMDASNVWYLYVMEAHDIATELSHITIRR